MPGLGRAAKMATQAAKQTETALLVSKAVFPMQDPNTGLVFEPGVPQRVVPSAWTREQAGWLVPVVQEPPKTK